MEEEWLRVAAGRALATCADDEVAAMLQAFEEAQASGGRISERDVLASYFRRLGYPAEQAGEAADRLLAEPPADLRTLLD